MPDLESIVNWLQSLPPWGVYLALFASCYIENLFPPSPSDVIMLFIATLIGIGTIDLVPSIAIATLGSLTGFLTAFLIGRRYGRRLVESRKLPFLTDKALTKVDSWFDRWGYWVIVVNRFLAGTRAVISFFAGMSQMGLGTTLLLCAVSALAWNSAIIWLGSQVDWRRGEEILSQYGQIIMIVLGAAVLFFAGRWWLRRRKERGTAQPDARTNEAGGE